MLTISADGSHLPPLIILPLKEFPLELLDLDPALVVLDSHSSRKNGSLLQSLNKSKRHHYVRTARDERRALLSMTKEALYHSMYDGIVLTSFQRSGIFPFNPSIILSSPLIISDSNISPSSLQVNKKKRSGVRIDNCVLTSPLIIKKLQKFGEPS